MSIAGFIKNYKNANLRYFVIRNIIIKLKEEKYIGNLGKCLDVGCSAGQGCYALKKEGASEVYGIDEMKAQLDLASDLGFLDNGHAINLRMEQLSEGYNQGFFGKDLFDTITIFCYPYLSLENDDSNYNNNYNELEKSYKKIKELGLLTNLDILNNFSIPNKMESKVDRPLEQMLSVLNSSGKIILSTYPHDYIPNVFKKFNLSCKSYLVPEGLEPEKIVYVGSRK